MMASPVAATVAYAVARGLPFDRVTEATGLTLAEIIDPAGRLAETHMPAIWRLLSATWPDESVALQMAAVAPLSFFGPLAAAARNARDVRGALLTFADYALVLSSSLTITLTEGRNHAAIELRHAQDAEDDGCAAELAMAMGARFVHEVLEVDDLPLRVELSHGPHGPAAAYREFFSTSVSFRQSRNAIVLPLDVLDTPLRRYDPRAQKAIRAHLDLVQEQLARQTDPPELARMREAVGRGAARGIYSVSALARRLGMSVRTLQRQATELGVSPHKLLEEAREAHAAALLSDRDLGLPEVAELLGYSTESAFRRAFVRWTGQSPGRYRRAQLRRPNG